MNKKNRLLCFVITLSLLLIFSSCSGSSKSAANLSDRAETVQESTTAAKEYAIEDLEWSEGEEGQLPDLPEVITPLAVSRKIVRTVNINLQTKEYDNGIKTINGLVSKYNGYFAMSEIDGGYATVSVTSARYARFEAKIPAADLDVFLAELQEPFHVLSLSESAEDITRTYFDNQAQIDALEERRERLEKMLEDATKLETMLILEQEIADTITQINILYSRQEVMKSSVDLATVHIGLNEVVEYQPVVENPVTFGEEAGYAFRSAVNSFVAGARSFSLFFIRNFPTLIILALFAFLIIYIVRRQKKKAGETHEKQREEFVRLRQVEQGVNQAILFPDERAPEPDLDLQPAPEPAPQPATQPDLQPATQPAPQVNPEPFSETTEDSTDIK